MHWILKSFQRFQQSRDSSVSPINLPTILEAMKSEIEDHFKERILALYVSQILNLFPNQTDTHNKDFYYRNSKWT